MDLRRHQLVRLSAAGWRRASLPHADAQAQRCFAHWAAHDLPLIVATQAAAVDPGVVSLGLPAPAVWGRARFAVRVARADLRIGASELPTIAECEGEPLKNSTRWSSLRAALLRIAASARVHGSFGWQHLTGLRYVHERSDLDLLLPAADARQADAIVAALMRCGGDAPRLDGELCFVDGGAVAWREWAAWRAGRVPTILVKRLRGACLEADAAWLDAQAAA
ncbi:MAG TPA: malonate decarboxylase holo-[acyl-carrier-protein] synthase [Caldimonas sp.]